MSLNGETQTGRFGAPIFLPAPCDPLSRPPRRDL